MYSTDGFLANSGSQCSGRTTREITGDLLSREKKDLTHELSSLNETRKNSERDVSIFTLPPTPPRSPTTRMSTFPLLTPARPPYLSVPARRVMGLSFAVLAEQSSPSDVVNLRRAVRPAEGTIWIAEGLEARRAEVSLGAFLFCTVGKEGGSRVLLEGCRPSQYIGDTMYRVVCRVFCFVFVHVHHILK